MRIVGAAMESRYTKSSPSELRHRYFGSRGSKLRELFRETTNVGNHDVDPIHSLAVSRQVEQPRPPRMSLANDHSLHVSHVCFPPFQGRIATLMTPSLRWPKSS